MVMMLTLVIPVGIIVMIVAVIRLRMPIAWRFSMWFSMFVNDHSVTHGRSRQGVDADAKDQQQAQAKRAGAPQDWGGLIAVYSHDKRRGEKSIKCGIFKLYLTIRGYADFLNCTQRGK
jgi:hypothetical protein